MTDPAAPERAAPIGLASLTIEGFAPLAAARRVALVPTAANGLEDREAVVAATRDRLPSGVHVEVVDLERVDAEALDARLRDVDLVVASGGDPFRLLARARAAGAADALRRARRRGVAYLGVSAGATVTAPTLEPLRAVSPFHPAGGADLTGLGLADLLVLPHDDRPGRRARHEAALAAHGRAVRMLALADDELVVAGDGSWTKEVAALGWTLRPAAAGDAADVAEVFLAAGRVAWPFVEAGRREPWEPPVARWLARIEELAACADADDLVVATDARGVAGFVWVRAASDEDAAADGPHPDADAAGAVGEVAAFYTHPRVWGAGLGRRLMALGLDRLRVRDCRRAILYTEERNRRARAIYERDGWRADGVARERTFLGVPLRELRYARPL